MTLLNINFSQGTNFSFLIPKKKKNNKGKIQNIIKTMKEILEKFQPANEWSCIFKYSDLYWDILQYIVYYTVIYILSQNESKI